MAKAMYTNPRRRRRRRRRSNPRRRRSYTRRRSNPRRRGGRFKLLPTMSQIKMSLWGGAGFLTNKFAGNGMLYVMVRWVPGFNNLPGVLKALSAPIVGTAVASFAVNLLFPRKGRAYAQAGVNIALGYGLLQALLGSTGIANKIHPVVGALLSGDDYISSGSLAGMHDYVTAGLEDYVQAPRLGEAFLPGAYAAEGYEPYMSSGSLMAGVGSGGFGDFYYGV